MNVAAANAKANILALPPQAAANRTSHASQRQAPTAAPTGDTFEPTSDTATGEVPGVIRNLLAGHYKGVADVRLRIVHHDRLVQAQAGALAPAADAGVDDLGAVVSENIQALLDGGALTEEQTAAVETLQSDFADTLADLRSRLAENADRDAFNTGVQAAADSLLESIRELLAPPEPAPETDAVDEELIETLVETLDETATDETPEEVVTVEETPEVIETTETPETAEGGEAAEPEIATETPEVVAFDVEAFFEQFAAAIQGSIDSLTSSLTGVSLLPPLSPDPGHGRAYEKFLATYNQLYNNPAATPSESVDLVA